MFSCACSLRSTQCAALIALAAAAGIMRVEPARAERPATPPRAAEHTAEGDPFLLSLTERRFQYASEFAPWLMFHLAAGLMAEAAEAASVSSVPPPAADDANLHFPSPPDTVGPSAQRHSYPFAVGPPQHRPTSNPRVDDTLVSGDFVTCGSLVSRVASCPTAASNARLTRDRTPAPMLVRVLSRPGSALRGEPVDISFRPAFLGMAGLRRSHRFVARALPDPIQI